MSPDRPVLIGLKASNYRDEMAGWVRGQGFQPFVTDTGRVAVEWLRRATEAVSFLDRDLDRFEGQEVWRVVRPTATHRLVLMAVETTKELWLSALTEGVATVLPLPAERDAVLCALRIAVGR